MILNNISIELPETITVGQGDSSKLAHLDISYSWEEWEIRYYYNTHCGDDENVIIEYGKDLMNLVDKVKTAIESRT